MTIHDDLREVMGLLPCPFCGADPKYHTHKGVWRMHHVYHCGTSECPAKHGPGPSGPSCPTFATQAQAIAAWNHRPALLDRQEGEDDSA